MPRTHAFHCVLILASLLAACSGKGSSDDAASVPAAADTAAPPVLAVAPPVTYECHLVGGGSATYMRFDDEHKAVLEGRDKDQLTVMTAPVIYNADGILTWSRNGTDLSFDKKTGELDWSMNGGAPQKDLCTPLTGK